MLRILKYLFFTAGIFLTSCWPSSISLQDSGSMPADWKQFSVATLQNTAPNAPLTYPPLLTEAVKDGIQNRTRLLLSKDPAGGQIYIEGTVTGYSIVPVALQPGDNAARNRLTVSVSFTIFISEPEEDKMVFTSTRFADYPATADISTIESSLLDEINEQVVQDVLNQLFSNW